MNNIVILDVETTGDNYLLDEICQMSYIILDKNLRILKSKNFFFMVDYVHFKSNKKKLNIEELKLLSNNKTFKDRYNEIFNDLNNNLIVCHNCEHDISFLKSEFMRVDNKNNFVYEEFCTMKYYTNILKLPSESFGYKYPKLIEVMPYLNIKRGDIHKKSKEIFSLADKEINFHDSRVDSVATYLIAIKTEALINKYRDLLNRSLDAKINLYEDKELSEKLDENINEEIDSERKVKESQDISIVNSNNSKPKINIIKDLFSVKGTVGRKKYIIYLIAIICIFNIFGRILANHMTINGLINENSVNMISRPLTIAMSFMLLPISIKRLKDCNQPMWLIIFLFIDLLNLFFILDLCISKGKNRLYDGFGSKKKRNEYKKVSVSKASIIIVLSLLMPIIIIALLYMGFSMSEEDNTQNYSQDEAQIYNQDDTQNSPKQNEAIEIAKYTLHHEKEPYTRTIITYIEDKVKKINPYCIYDWHAYEIEDNIYLVCFEFDKNDDDPENGYNSYPYEVDIDTKTVTQVSSNELIKKYEDLGYFDDKTYINEFKEEILNNYN